MSVTVYSVIPLIVNVFPLLVCPYAKMLADQIDNQRPDKPGRICQYRSCMNVNGDEEGKTAIEKT